MTRSDVKRYTPLYAETITDRFCHMVISPTGGFVLASDYDALVTENVILEGSLRLYERYREALVRIADSDYRGNCPTEIEIARRALGPEYD